MDRQLQSKSERMRQLVLVSLCVWHLATVAVKVGMHQAAQTLKVCLPLH